jgi:hypothetical protein
MSEENEEIVRKPLQVRERSSRTLDQRLFLRFPRLATASFRLITKLPPGSRLRQAVVWRAARLALPLEAPPGAAAPRSGQSGSQAAGSEIS